MKRQRPEEGPAFHGNYRGYYNYRTTTTEGAARDPRLDLLREDLFRGRKCLDIGCNSGVFTRLLAEHFGCRYMLGVDIDAKLVAEARRGGITEAPGSKAAKRPAGGELAALLSDSNAFFRREDFVQDEHPDKDYDTITCFSVSKWIHLHMRSKAYLR